MDTPEILNAFVAECQAALTAESPRRLIYQHMERLLADPVAFAAQVPKFTDDEVAESPRGWRLGGEHIVHQSGDLTVMALDTLPGIAQPPHDHNLNVCIGVFEGCEDQRFWQRTATGVTPTAGRSLSAGEVMALGVNAIHAISAPSGTPARAIHVYLGDIYNVDRSVFDPTTMTEYPMTSDRYDEFCTVL